jgi:2,4-dichlorophenol 6-monooxygenase
MQRIEIPVLVVGAGPVGLTAGILLSGQGIGNRIIDRRDGPHRAPQAHVVNPRTLEIFRAMGIDSAALREKATPRADGSHVMWVESLAGMALGRLPYERQGDENLVYTPTPLLNLSQHLLEPILLAHLRGTGGSDVQYRHRWEALEQDADGVLSRVEDLQTGARYEVRSRYVLAADGAGSRVREALGIEMIGPDQLQSFVMIHFEANLRGLVEDRPAILYWVLDPKRAGVFVAHHIEHTWVFMHPLDPFTEKPESFTKAVCAEVVRRAIGKEDVDIEVRTVSQWTMTAQIAERYNAGRVFLVGDSAHRFPPSGGMGMNTGIQDVHNLIWKIRAVEEGWGQPSLLDTYGTERRPPAQSNADASMMNALKMMEVLEALGLSLDRGADHPPIPETLADPANREKLASAIANQQEHFDMFGLQLGFSYEEGAILPDGTDKPVPANPVRDYVPTTRPGSRLPHAWVERAGARVSTLDLLPYDRFTLITGPDGSAWADAAATIKTPPIRCLVAGSDFIDSDGQWAKVCEIQSDGALLIRPDQHVAWRSVSGQADSARALTRALEAIPGRG